MFLDRPLDGFWLILLLAAGLGAQKPPVITPAPGMDAHARQVLNEARDAMGSSRAVDSLHSLEVDMSARQLLAPPMGRMRGPAPEQFSDVKLQFLLPNAFRRTVQIQPFAGYPPALTLTEVQNGEQAWISGQGRPMRMRFLDREGAPGGPRAFFFRYRSPEGTPPMPGGQGPMPPQPPAGAEGLVAPGPPAPVQQGTPEPGAQPAGPGKMGRNRIFGPPQDMLMRHLQQQAMRNLLMLTLWTPRSTTLQWHYFGTATLPGGVADVIDVAGPDHFSTRLFLDQKSHRLVMMQYRDFMPRRVMMVRLRRPPMREEGFGPHHGGQPELKWRQSSSPDHRRGFGPPPMGMGMPRPQPVDLHFSQFSREHGILMPHQIVATEHGQPVEQWTIRAVKWNPALPAADFQKAPEKGAEKK